MKNLIKKSIFKKIFNQYKINYVSTLKKYNFFLVEHRVYYLKGFKSYIEKIKYFSIFI
jgi:hypothetical protein